MRITICGLLIFMLSSATNRIESANITVIRDVHVIDVVAGDVRPDMAIVISDDRITAVTPAAELESPEGATTVEAAGQFAIPGLWDMHIHWYGQDSMQLFPINGVTGVRVMWGSFMHHAWRRAFEKQQRLGPHMLIGSVIIDGADPIWPGSLIATDAESGRKAVANAIKAKSDFAKVYSLLPREAYFAIAEEANRQGLPFDGHVPMMVSASEASEAGQRCMEHLYEMLLACSGEEHTLRAMQAELVEAEGKVRALSGSQVRRDVRRRALATYDAEKAAQLFATFRSNNTWHCPTLTVNRNLAYLQEPEIQNNPDLQYIPENMLRFVAPAKDRFGDNDEARQFARAALEKKYEILLAMHRAGVRLLAGTDVLNPFCLPGFSLHGELQLMVEAGLTPAEALRTATINPAMLQGKESELGSISEGKIADIVLLTGNPLEQISNTTTIDSVILRGKRFDRATLDKLLEGFRRTAAADEPQPPS